MNKILKFVFLLIGLQSIAQFTQKPLPYAYNALEPYVDAQTMEIHFSKHHAGYVKNLNAAVVGTKAEKMNLQEILANVSQFSTAIRNNAGGHYNHELFWSILTPKKDTKISPELEKAIKAKFTSIDSLKIKLNAAATSRFGSGWAWLITDKDGKLSICSTANQDNPLMDIADVKGTPIMGIDVWEHAYYLKHQNKRADYLSAIWNVLNWDEVSDLYEKATYKKTKFDNWQALKDFHKIMSQTFHASEEGNLQPIKEQSDEMVKKAEALVKNIPAKYNTKKITDVVGEIVVGSKKLDKMVKSKKSDKAITESLSKLHDTFHQIVGLCGEKN